MNRSKPMWGRFLDDIEMAFFVGYLAVQLIRSGYEMGQEDKLTEVKEQHTYNVSD